MAQRSRRFSLFVVLVVLAHAMAVIWHLSVISNMPPGLPDPQTLVVIITVNLLPVIGVILLFRKTYRFAAILIFVPMAMVFAIGGYEHFLNSGPGSVFGVSDPQWAWQFRASAILLIALELLGCWIGAQSWLLGVHEPTPASYRQ